MSESSNSGTSQKKPTAESTSRYNDNLPPPKPTKSRRKEKEKVRADFGSSNEPEVGIRRIDIVDVEADDDDIEYLDGDTDEEEECDFLTVENEDQMEDAASLSKWVLLLFLAGSWMCLVWSLRRIFF